MTQQDAEGSSRTRSRRLLLGALLAFWLPAAAAAAEPPTETPSAPEAGSAEAACDESKGIDEKPPAEAEAPPEGSPAPERAIAPGEASAALDAERDAALDAERDAALDAERDAALDAERDAALDAERDADLEALSRELETSRASDSDPLEPLNRRMLALNRGFDAVLLDPLTRAYAFLVPELARQSVRNAFANLNTPVILVNDLLQLEGRDALVTTARFVINSTMGMGGLFDAASTMGLEAHVSNFSETLSTAGIPMGPYLVLPLVGPTTVRDGVGTVVDLALSPQIYFLPVTSVVIVTGSDGFSLRERHSDELAALRESSVDYYAALRSAYLDSKR